MPSTPTSAFAPGLFAGKRALVTGGGTGIGLAITSELLPKHPALAWRVMRLTNLLHISYYACADAGFFSFEKFVAPLLFRV